MMRRCGLSGGWAGLGLAVALALGSVQTALAAGRRTLEPKLHGDIPGGVFTSVARVEGTETSGNSVVLEDGRLYFGAAHTLYVYDVAKPLKPRLLGSVGGIGAIRQMAVWKGMVYIASRETGMWIVDARNPSAPKLLSRFDTIELATGISVCGNLVMLGQRQNGVEFIDVADPLRPAHIRIEKTRESQSTLYRDGICYSGDWGSGEVTMIDARDMRTVKTLRTVKLRGNGDGIDIQGNLLYASTGHHYHDLSAKRWRAPKPGEPGYGEGHALEIIDIADPAAPKVLGRCKFDTFYTIGMDMWTPRASGDHVFCADTFNGLYAVDAKNPADMRIVGRITVPDPGNAAIPGTPVTGVAVGDGAVYLSARDCGLVVAGCPVARARKAVYPDEPAHLDYRADYRGDSARFDAWLPKRRGQVRAVAPFGDFAYVACGQAGLAVLRRTAKGYVESAALDLPFCGDVKVRDGKLYSAEALQGLAVYDLADPVRPRELERVTDFGTAVCCPLWLWTPKTSPLVVVSDRESGYAVMDPAHGWKCLIRNGGCPGWDRYFSDEPVGGRYFAQSLANIGFSWIDMGATPPKAIRSRVNTSGLNDGCLAWRDDRLLMVSKGEFLYLKPGQPENADGSHWKGVPFARPEGPRGGQPAWDGKNALALTERIDKSVWRLDMSDENAPRVLWGEKTVGNPDLAAFHDGRLLVPCGYQGLLIEKRPVAEPPSRPRQIVLVGDSTLAPRKPEHPVGSWGEALAPHLRDGVAIRDFAVGGRTVRTTLPTWGKTLEAIGSGDFVIIQFGINDANPRKFVGETEFKSTLRKFVDEARAKGGLPIVCSPLANAGYAKGGREGDAFRLDPNRTAYGAFARTVAEEAGVPFVDMTALTAAELTRRGRERALACFVGDTVRDGKPVFDTTHPSKAGARAFAELFVREAASRRLPVAGTFAERTAAKPAASAGLVTYPEYPEAVTRDYAYAVRVVQGEVSRPLPVYNHCEKSSLVSRTRGGDVNRRFCEFAFDGEPVRVDIRVVEDVKSYKVFPARLGLKSAFRDGVISVWLEKPAYFGVQLNDYDKTILSVFADAPEDPAKVPRKDAPGVLFVEGWKDAPGADGVIETGAETKEIYLAPGSVLNARLRITGRGTWLHGRGMILDPLSDIFRYDQTKNTRRGLVSAGAGCTIEDVKLVDARTFNICAWGQDVTIRHVKELASMMCSDGFTNGGKGLLAEHCWLYVGDNALVVSGLKDSVYRDIALGTSCAAIFPQGNNANVRMEDIDVFRADDGLINNFHNGVLRRNNKWSEMNGGLQKKEPGPQDLQHLSQDFSFRNLSAVDCTLFSHFFSGRNMGTLPKTFAFDGVSLPVSTGRTDWRLAGKAGGPTVIVQNDPKKWLITDNYALAFTNLWIAGVRARFGEKDVAGADKLKIGYAESAAAREVPLAPDRHEVNWICPYKVFRGPALVRDWRFVRRAEGERRLPVSDPGANLVRETKPRQSVWQRAPSWSVKLETSDGTDEARRVYELVQCERGAGMQAVVTEGALERGAGVYRLTFEAQAECKDGKLPLELRCVAQSNEWKQEAKAAVGGDWTPVSVDFNLPIEPRVTDLVSIGFFSAVPADRIRLRKIVFVKTGGS